MEFLLFAVIGLVAIGAAVAMLVSENAIYSALFLIINFLCVAFFYLMLEAPFLAMVQIAVYAGAIMVLFLFVIMLLGAERVVPGHQIRRFGWLAPLTLGLSLAFVIAVGAAIGAGQIDSDTRPPGQALLSFVHAAPPDEGEASGNEVQVAIAQRHFDVYIDGELAIEGLEFNDEREEAQAFIPVEEGEHTVTFSPAGSDLPLVTTTVNLSADTVASAVLYGEESTALTLTTVDLTTEVADRNNGEVIVFNAFTPVETIDLVNIESELFADSRTVTPVLTDIALGSAGELIEYPRGTVNWVLIEGDTADRVDAEGPTSTAILRRLNDTEVSIEPNSTHLLVLAGARALSESIQPRVIAVSDPASDVFGGPAGVGAELFTTYVLPFQLVAILLLAAMIGVIVMTLRTVHEPKPSSVTRRKVSRPLTSVIASQTGGSLTSGAPQLEAPESESDEQPEPAGD